MCITGATTENLPPGVLYRVKASYKYQAEDVDELNFEVGEVIDVVEYDDSEDQVWLLQMHFSLSFDFFFFWYRRKGGSWVLWKAQVKKECFQPISLGQCEKRESFFSPV